MTPSVEEIKKLISVGWGTETIIVDDLAQYLHDMEERIKEEVQTNH